MAKGRAQWVWFGFCRNLCRIFCWISFRIRVCGKENIPKQGAVLLISNHQSFLDPLFCGDPLKRQLTFLARDTLFTNRFFGALLMSVNAIPVRRGEADLTAMKAIIARLKAGGVVCLFPEGTRTEDGRISEFKPGFGLLCRRGNAAVVPTVIDGAFECWPKNQKFPTLGSHITVQYAPPITADQIAKMDERQLAAELTATLRKMQNDIRLKAGKASIDY